MHRLRYSLYTLLDGSWPASLQGMWCVCVRRESRFKHIIPHLFTCYQSHTFSHLLSTWIALISPSLPLSPLTPPLVVAFTLVIVFRAYKCSIFLPRAKCRLQLLHKSVYANCESSWTRISPSTLRNDSRDYYDDCVA